MTRRLLVVGGALATAAVALHTPPQRDAPRIELSAATGALRVSRPDTAILAASNMRPGEAVESTVAVSNPSRAAVRLALVSGEPDGALAEVLQLSLDGGDTPAAGGSLRAFAGCHELGTLAPGAVRTFRFRAGWPRGDDDNAYAGARASVAERWVASAGGCGGARAGGEGEPPRLVISHRRIGVHAGRAPMRVRCVPASADSRCRGSLELQPTGLEHRLRTAYAGVRLDVPAGAARTLRPALPGATRARLRRRPGAVVLAVAHPARGSSMRPVRRYITLIRAGR